MVTTIRVRASLLTAFLLRNRTLSSRAALRSSQTPQYILRCPVCRRWICVHQRIELARVSLQALHRQLLEIPYVGCIIHRFTLAVTKSFKLDVFLLLLLTIYPRHYVSCGGCDDTSDRYMSRYFIHGWEMNERQKFMLSFIWEGKLDRPASRSETQAATLDPLRHDPINLACLTTENPVQYPAGQACASISQSDWRHLYFGILFLVSPESFWVSTSRCVPCTIWFDLLCPIFFDFNLPSVEIHFW